MQKQILKQKILAGLMLFLMTAEVLRIPVTMAFAFPTLKDIFGSAAALSTPAQHRGIIAVLTEDSLFTDTKTYSGLQTTYPASLKAATLQDRIKRYALDAQRSQPFTKAIIIRVKKDQPVPDIADSLEKLYLEGDGTSGEINKLAGVVVIGDVPLPVVNKNGYRFVSMFPYTDFEEKTYVYDAASGDYIPNPDVTLPKADVWHGVIKPPVTGDEGRKLLASYFDKNYLYHCKDLVCSADAKNFQQFTRKLLFMDLLNEFKQMDKLGYNNYLRNIANWENLSYQRFSKHLLQQLVSAANTEQKGGDKIDNDGDGKIDEDPKNGVDDDKDGEAGSPLIGLADGIDNDGDGLIDEPDEGRFGLCDFTTPITKPQKIKDCSIPGKPLMTGDFYNVKPGSIYKVADGIDNNNDGQIDEKIDQL